MRLFSFLAVAFILLAPVSHSAGDVFVLKQGGRIQGVRIEGGTSTADTHTIRTTAGVTVTLEAVAVQRVDVCDELRQQYVRLAPTLGDNATDQWSLAEWCRKHGLDRLRQKHLQRIVQLDPNHAEARYALGYSQFRGQWATQEEVQRQRGLQRHDGHWLLSQEVQLQQEAKAIADAETKWRLRLHRWRSELDEENAAEAYRQISTLR